jgi:polysaccharide biosynthesis transport protein
MFRKRPVLRGLVRDTVDTAELGQSYRQLLARLVQALPDGEARVCLVASASPGEGRTTLALNLAECAADPARPALVVDGDTVAPQVHAACGLARGPGLADLLRGQARCADVLRACAGNPGLHVLTSGEGALNAALLTATRELTHIFEELRKQHSWIFIDTAPLLTAAGAPLLGRYAAGAVVAARYGRTRAPRIAAGIALLSEARIPILGAVLTQRRYTIPSFTYRHL